jgi:excisionase family DNA binding protein
MQAEEIRAILEEIAEKVTEAMSDMRPLLTIPEVVERLKLSDSTVRKLVRDGQIASIRVGGNQVRVEQRALDAYLAAQRDVATGGVNRA